MDNVRVILWAVFASLLWISITTYQQQNAPQVPDAPTALTTEDGPDNLPAVDDGALPGMPATNADISDSATTVATTSAPAKDKVIAVTTDVLNIEISTRGGTLINALLPTYPVDKDNPDIPIQLLNNDPETLYLLRSGLRSTEGRPEATHHAVFTSAAERFELGETKDELVVPLVWEEGGIRVTKTYTFVRGSYAVNLDYKIENTSSEPYSMFNYLQLHRAYIPVERSMFNVDTYSFDGPVVYDGEAYEKLDAEDLQESPLTANYTGGWLAAIQHHFLSAAVPSNEATYAYKAGFDGRIYTVTASSPVQVVAPGSSADISAKFFIGPKLQEQLAETADGLPLTVDYGILAVLAQPLFWVLQQVQKIVVNWGWTIIIVTFLIKLVFYKLTQASGRSMAKMRKLQPRLKALQERYKDDRQAMSAALMEMYKKEKVNPAAGCLPMLVQIPFFIAFYWVLLESVEMRQAPFMLWITDLSSRDPYFVLPLLMGGAMFIQQKLNPAPPDPVQAKVMAILPLVFTVFFAFFPAGLVLYWLTNSVLSILQQWNINRVVAAEAA